MNTNLEHSQIGVRKDFDVSIKESLQAKLTADECKKYCKSAGVEYLEGYEKNVYQFTLTDTTVDRYNEVVIPKGVDLTLYKTNPVVLAFHDSGNFPVGSCIKVWYDKASESVKGWILFMDERVDASGGSSTIMKMVANGFIRTGSIGFIPKKVHKASAEEILKYKFNEERYPSIIDESELLEFSIVPIPANPSARAEVLTKAVGKLSDKEKSFLEKLGTSVPGTIENKGQDVLPITVNKQDTPENVKAGTIDTANSEGYIQPCMVKINVKFNSAKMTQEQILASIASYKDSLKMGEELSVEIVNEPEMVLSGIDTLSTKAGASISKKNKQVIKLALESCNKACEHLNSLTEMEEGEEDPTPLTGGGKSISDSESYKKSLEILDNGLKELLKGVK